MFRFGVCGIALDRSSWWPVHSGKEAGQTEGLIADWTGGFFGMSLLNPIGLPIQFGGFHFRSLSNLNSAVGALFFLPGVVQSVIADVVLSGFGEVPEPALDEVMGFEALSF